MKITFVIIIKLISLLLISFFIIFFAGKEYETDQVFVSNLPSTVTEDAIKELFGSIGIIKVSL